MNAKLTLIESKTPKTQRTMNGLPQDTWTGALASKPKIGERVQITDGDFGSIITTYVLELKTLKKNIFILRTLNSLYRLEIL